MRSNNSKTPLVNLLDDGNARQMILGGWESNNSSRDTRPRIAVGCHSVSMLNKSSTDRRKRKMFYMQKAHTNMKKKIKDELKMRLNDEFNVLSLN